MACCNCYQSSQVANSAKVRLHQMVSEPVDLAIHAKVQFDEAFNYLHHHRNLGYVRSGNIFHSDPELTNASIHNVSMGGDGTAMASCRLPQRQSSANVRYGIGPDPFRSATPLQSFNSRSNGIKSQVNHISVILEKLNLLSNWSTHTMWNQYISKPVRESYYFNCSVYFA